MSSELLRALRPRVDEIIRPHRDVYGEDAPVVKMALRVLAEAEDLDRELSERTVSTAEAAAATGWSPETLQRWARARIEDADLPDAWRGLRVVRSGSGYGFVLSSIPPRSRN